MAAVSSQSALGLCLRTRMLDRSDKRSPVRQPSCETSPKDRPMKAKYTKSTSPPSEIEWVKQESLKPGVYRFLNRGSSTRPSVFQTQARMRSEEDTSHIMASVPETVGLSGILDRRHTVLQKCGSRQRMIQDWKTTHDPN
eukprot:2837190-Amphidinium_carterae.1